MAKTILTGLGLMLLMSGCVQSPEELNCVKVAKYVSYKSGTDESPKVIVTEHERLIADGIMMRGVGKFKQHAYLEAYSVCKSLEAGNGVTTGRL